MGRNRREGSAASQPTSAARVTVISVLLLYALAGVAQAGLRVHPQNTHYFQDTQTGEAIMITSYGTVAPSSNECDYVADIERHVARGMSWIRMWHMLPWAASDPEWPWARSGTYGAYMGGGKFDLNTWNPEYWFRLRDCAARAAVGGSYVEIMLFDRCSMAPADQMRWSSNPWASDNNINGLELPGGSGQGTPDFYYFRWKPNLRSQQERYVRKMIDETISYPNVIYEVENEHLGLNSSDWAGYYSQFIKSYITQRYPGQSRLVSYSSLESDLEACYLNPSIDIVNRHFGAELEADPSIAGRYIQTRWQYGKAINIDEFANGVADYDLLREECWTIVTSGGNFHIEDTEPTARPYDVVANIEAFKTASNWDFVHAAPNGGGIALNGGYCMAKPSSEYVCYFPDGGTKLISLPYGNYAAKWWNPREGGFVGQTTFSHSGGTKRLSTPSANDWVLHVVYTGSAANPALPWFPWIPVYPPPPIYPPTPIYPLPPIYPPTPINPLPPVYPVLPWIPAYTSLSGYHALA